MWYLSNLGQEFIVMLQCISMNIPWDLKVTT